MGNVLRFAAIISVMIFVLMPVGSRATQYQDSIWVYNDTCIADFSGSYEDYDEQHEANDADYAYSVSAEQYERFYFTSPDWDTGGTIDSAKVVVRAQATGSGGTAQMIVHYSQTPTDECAAALYTEDTLTLTNDWQNFEFVTTQSEYGDPPRSWWWLEFYFDEVYTTFTIDNVSMFTKGQNRVSWVFEVIYWTVEEAPSGQIINIGRNDETTHNSRSCRSVPDSRW